ncbi:hypothetical protein Kfla_0337 [Kribbella flavida DSM 17836]|uniref:Uncharacterized protein n=1 Tax=Kribbella flavida (strain DSM 17836 / JCM 10339 / NBRC 14399) TaxID=479435 RepID=D2PTE5_KRIFD|nr:hypothetical protein [Kribbella flavida]ADB29461.1 hypothetical protein Kfla_0337 [Kribbella flavida DSM 17836]
MRRRSNRIQLLTTGVAAAAVAGVAIAATAFTGGTGGTAAADTQVAAAGSAAAVAAAPSKKESKATKYTFQNKRPAVGTLAPGQQVKLGHHLSFTTRGTRWAVISRVPGEPQYEPFGWRRTVGNTNLGDGRALGLQSVGPVHSSVFRNERVSTVVYTLGGKAWYAKVYRLAGIPGWVQSSVVMSGAKQPRPDAKGPGVSVFAYDAGGRLLGRFGNAVGDPLNG